MRMYKHLKQSLPSSRTYLPLFQEAKRTQDVINVQTARNGKNLNEIFLLSNQTMIMLYLKT